jgi:hypothetical protein
MHVDRNSCTPASQSLPIRNSWTWIKTAALACALTAITVGTFYAAGVGSIATLCCFGGPVFILPFLIHMCKSPYRLKLSLDDESMNIVAQRLLMQAQEEVVDFGVAEGEAYDLNRLKDKIIYAIDREATLSWKGKRSTDEQIAILPNLHIGIPSEKSPKDLVIQFSPTLESLNERAIQEVWKQNKNIYFLDSCVGGDSLIPCDLQDLHMNRRVFDALLEGKSVLLTYHPGCQHLPDKNRSSDRFDVGILLIRFLIKVTELTQTGVLTGITADQVQRYVEKQLRCTFKQKIYYPGVLEPIPFKNFLAYPEFHVDRRRSPASSSKI